MNTYCCRIAYGSEQYRQTIQHRDEILRKPLHLHFTEEQLAAENEQVHLACFDAESEKLLACLILVPEANRKIKMRQVAVAANLQRQGIGQKLVAFAENWAVQAGFSIIHCHARDTAVPFYLKLGYHIEGNPFTEVTILHYYMEKQLTQ
ncbi:GNAT family N-acetyltransferase [Sphingobacteriales bacterium UPWRP_1]|nr:hypothetical protein BVG80_14295 [Sphingobacteriales bacterium TSM_CSM]PSJ71487.1 GNAT family N-acetyltransferase [Sphingobacteriales bacterium UPWRP_1]